MKRTISLKLVVFEKEAEALFATQTTFSTACKEIVPYCVENRCWNRVAVHHLSYYSVRKKLPTLGSQMVCNAIKKVCTAYKVLKIKKSKAAPTLTFKESASVHYDKRTYSLKGDILSLYTVQGRINCQFSLGKRQQEYLEIGTIKEGELIRKGKRWFFNLVLDLPEVALQPKGKILALDVGENNLATTSEGTIYGGGILRFARDKFLKRRAKLQSNGSKSAKHLLKRISGREKRHVKETNHLLSKQIVQEAVKSQVGMIVMENLTNIRRRIRGNKRLRSRLHRWAWHQLQLFVAYKAQSEGIDIVYVNPAYTSQTCSSCGSVGSRHKHLFTCSHCESYRHSDRNAAINLRKLGESVVSSMAPVNGPMVAA